jgi:hypothetical protein
MRIPRLPALIATLVLVAVLALIFGLVTDGRSGLAGLIGSQPSATHPRAEAAASGQTVKKGHAAPDLEALLPNKINGVALKKGSTTGSVVFGSDAFSRSMTGFLTSIGKAPTDLRFANAQDPSGALDLETGVFQLHGVAASRLRQAIVNSSRPDAPGLTISSATLSGRRVTTLVYPGGSVLYLYGHGDLVFYVGTQSEVLASRVLAQYP